MTLGALAVTSEKHRRTAGVPLGHAIEMPFDGVLGPETDTVEHVRAYLDNHSTEPGKPAAIIVETVQAEGGVNPADFGWLQRLDALAKATGILLIIDDIQAGCGRTGPFFSFEPAGIKPDLICLSKAISGFGLACALVLIRPEHDVWLPGEHNCTFRGNNLAFVTGTAAIQNYWRDDGLETAVMKKGCTARDRLTAIANQYKDACGPVRERGLIWGLPFTDPDTARNVSRAAFERGLLIETAGPLNEGVKLLPPLTIEDQELAAGLDIIEDSVEAVLS
jgi:diaminobutyrate-2-oxoglutarate transaminase